MLTPVAPDGVKLPQALTPRCHLLDRTGGCRQVGNTIVPLQDDQLAGVNGGDGFSVGERSASYNRHGVGISKSNRAGWRIGSSTFGISVSGARSHLWGARGQRSPFVRTRGII